MANFDYKPYHQFIEELYNNDPDISMGKIAKKILREHNLPVQQDTLRRYISVHLERRGIRNKDERSEVINNHAKEMGVDMQSVRYGWLKSKEASFFFTNPDYKTKEQNEFVEELLDMIRDKSPVYPNIKRTLPKEGHLLIVNPADIHSGKLATAFGSGDEYNSNIAVERVHEGVQGILDKASGYNIDKIVFVGGNDILHVDNTKRTTTSGTPQDTDGMWYDNFRLAFKLYTEVLEKLASVADVHFVFCPSNHDFTNGFFLCQAVEAYFRNNSNITFDCSMQYRKYFTYGSNLIGFTHGDGGKVQDLPLLLAHESPDWSATKHRYVYIAHIHHKSSKDYQSVCVESMRSPSGTDFWHKQNGYCNNVKAVEGFLHHKEFGQTCRFNHIF